MALGKKKPNKTPQNKKPNKTFKQILGKCIQQYNTRRINKAKNHGYNMKEHLKINMH